MKPFIQAGFFFLTWLLGNGSPVYAQKVSIEAASRDVTLSVRGPEREIDSAGGIALVSFEETKSVSVNRDQVAVLADENRKVTKILSFRTTDLTIPEQGFALLASKSEDCKFLSDNFREGDIVQLRVDGEVRTLKEVVAVTKPSGLFDIRFNQPSLFTSLETETIISGSILHFNPGSGYKIIVEENGKIIREASCTTGGIFSLPVFLKEGVNYLDVKVMDETKELFETSFVIYRKSFNPTKPEIVMWVEQFPNALHLTNEEAIETMVLKSKAAGVTAFGLDVKGPEGYVSYKKNERSHSPYFTSTTNPKKKVEPSEMDLLESFITIAHKHRLKVYTSFNFFTEGNVTTGDYAVLKNHPDWEEIVQRPEDKGRLLKISESVAGQEARDGKRIILGFVNPADTEVQNFQLLRVEEVLQNYAVDGIVMDRCRYDNLYADFSEISRQQFAEYLKKEGKLLEQFPADAFLISENGKMIEGKYFIEWITFRASVIKQFTDRVRALVDKYKKEKNPNLKLAAYAGSWFEVYWQNGVNWSSKSFRYNERLKFPESRLYTDKYYQTSYTGNIDFLMIGTYYKTTKEINKYITLGNILTNGELPLYGSMSLPDLKNEEQAPVFGASLTQSSGLMVFDLCYVDWTFFTENLRKAIRENDKTMIK
ncbi:MAG: family 10 glycosylhydrolase [Dysgonamonadaceae bacterium]|nr:family 10 glycosylhydrolase [Dysgonamonadaceae bacterium]